MVCRRWARQRGVRSLGVAFVILSLVHPPLPEPDFHNIRHHDSAGEVCAYHDHLLRWHPGAGSAEDVAVLHWHWFVLAPGRPNPPAPGDGPAWHAHAPDWQVSTWDDGPQLAPDPHARWDIRPAPCPFALGGWTTPGASVAALPALKPPSPVAFCATFAPRVSLAALLQRWAC
jgi:hypothetical protein